MCHETTGEAHDRPLFPEDVDTIAKNYPALNKAGVRAIYQAITDHHWPKPAVLIAVLELVDRARRHDHGYYQYPSMPFSAMDMETLERVQTEATYAFHSVFESMALAERNLVLMNKALEQHFGLKLVLFCDCGCSIVPAERDVFNESWYQEINQLRSLAEAFGTKVTLLPSFNDPEWMRRYKAGQLDMGPAEMSSYSKMYRILLSLPSRPERDIRTLVSPQFAELFVAKV